MVTAATTPVGRLVRFGSYEADFAAAELRKNAHRIHLREQSFQVLAALLERPGEVVTRDELRERLWHGEVFVDFENNLNAIVARLRQALCDSADHPRYIETLPRHGYRFICPIEPVGDIEEGLTPIPITTPAVAHNPWLGGSRTAALAQIAYTAVALAMFSYILEVADTANQAFIRKDAAFGRAVFVSELSGFFFCLADFILVLLMFRHHTGKKLLNQLFPVYCALNLISTYLLIGFMGSRLPPAIAAITLPIVTICGVCGIFYQRKWIQQS